MADEVVDAEGLFAGDMEEVASSRSVEEFLLTSDGLFRVEDGVGRAEAVRVGVVVDDSDAALGAARPFFLRTLCARRPVYSRAPASSARGT